MADLITLDDVKAGLPIRAGNTQFDAQLSQIISIVTGLIEVATRRKFDAGIYSEIFHVQAGATQHYDFVSDTNTSGVFLSPSGLPFVLSEAPLLDPTTIKVYYSLTHQFTEDTALFADDFVVLPEKNCVYVNRALMKSRDSVKITYEGGYAEVPQDLKFAAVMQAQHLFQRAQPENVSTSSDKENKKGEAYATKSGLLPEVAQMIAPYRRLLRGRG